MTHTQFKFSPLHTLLITVSGVFLAEVVAMVVLYVLPPAPYGFHVLLDASLMTFLIFPVLYFLSFRRLLLHINERKRDTEALVSTNEQLRELEAIIDQSPAIAFRVRAEEGWPIEFVSPNVSQLGYTAEDLTSGKIKYSDIIHPDDRERVTAELAAHTSGGSEQFSHRYRLLRADGEARWLDYRTRIRRNVAGAATHYQGILLDITEQKEAEEELRRTNRELQALTKAEQKQRRRAEVLGAASVALAQSLDLELVSELSLEYVRQLVPFDWAEVVLRESEGLLVRVDGQRGGNGDRKTAPGLIQVDQLPCLEEMLSTQCSVCIDDIQECTGWVNFSGHDGTRSWLGVPLVVGGRTIGFYSLERDEPGAFVEEQIQFVEALAGQAAVAIQNAWLFEQVRLGSERLQALSRRLVEIQESERHYISRELHDEAGQALTSLVMVLELLDKEAGQPERVRVHVAEMERKVQQLIKDLHRLAKALRPATLDHLGLEAAVRQNVEAVAKRYGLMVQFETSGISNRLPGNVETILYRVIQEALTNVARHAHATRADVLLKRRGNGLVIVVEDDGVGFEPEQAGAGQRLGMLGMRERAEMLGGELIVESAPGKGTTIVVEVPYDDPDSSSR